MKLALDYIGRVFVCDETIDTDWPNTASTTEQIINKDDSYGTLLEMLPDIVSRYNAHDRLVAALQEIANDDMSIHAGIIARKALASI